MSEQYAPMRSHSESEPLLTVVSKRPWGQHILGTFLVVMVISALISVATNERFNWELIGTYLFAEIILKGVLLTITLTVVAMVFSVLVGGGVALAQSSKNPVLRLAASVYSWVFRAVPPLVQLLLWSFAAALYPVIKFGIPFGPTLFEIPGTLPLFVAALFGLGFSEAAYMSEIIRGGMLSVDRGQVEAGKALGLKRSQVFRKVSLPQAMRVIIPPFGNEVITMLKTTSLVSVIAYQDLLYSAQLVYSRNFQQIPMLIVASLWYLALAGILSIVQSRVEKRFGRSTAIVAVKGLTK